MMKEIILLVTIVTCMCSFTKKQNIIENISIQPKINDGYSITYYENGNIESEGNYVNDSKEGAWKYYYIHGKLNSIKTFKNNLEDGISKFYHLNGDLAAEITYNSGVRNGILKLYFSEKKPSLELNYKNGLKNGNYKEYDDKGKIIVEGRYNLGEKDGIWKIVQAYDYSHKFNETYIFGVKIEDVIYNFIEGSGTNLSEYITYQNGKKNGTYSFKPSQEYKFQINFLNGKKNGAFKISRIDYNNPNGYLMYEAKFINNLAEGVWVKYDNYGNVLLEREYKNGIVINETRYIKQDKIENKKEGKIFTNSNGERFLKILLSEDNGNFKNGLKEGYWDSCDENYDKNEDLDVSGRLNNLSEECEKGYYKNGLKQVIWEFYNQKDSSSIIIGNYFNGIKDGVWEKIRKKNGQNTEKNIIKFKNGFVWDYKNYFDDLLVSEFIFNGESYFLNNYNQDGNLSNSHEYANGDDKDFIYRSYENGEIIQVINSKDL